MPAGVGLTGATLTLEVSWGETSETLPASLSWVDESAYVHEVQFSTGRTTEFEGFPPGTMTVVLDNTTGRFDPKHSGGALYSDLNGKVGHPVRLRATKDAATYDLWRGFVEEITQAPDVQYAGRYSAAVLRCTDALADLNIATLPDSAWSVEVLRGVRFETDGSAVPAPPVHWWRLGESAGTVARDSTPLAGAVNGTYTGTTAPTYNYRIGLCNASPDGAIEFDGTDMHVVLGSHTLTPPFTVHAVVGGITAGRRNPIYAVGGFMFEITAANELKVTHNDGADTRTQTSAALTWDAGTVYSVSCTVLANAAPKLYRDTASVDSTAGGSGTLNAITSGGYIGRQGTDYFAGIIDEVLVYDFDVQALLPYGGVGSRLDDLFDVRRDAWDEDTYQLRTAKILDAAFWPPQLRSIATSSAWTYDPAEFAGASAGQYLAEIARSEDGLVYADPTGVVVCEDRRSRYTQARSTASQATLSDTAGSANMYRSIVRDGQSLAWVRNRIVARRKYGSDLVAQDGAFRRGQAEDLGTLMLRSEDDVQALLDRRLTARKTPAERITAITWDPRHGAGQWGLLARTISDRVTVQHTPVGVSQYTQTCWIEGVEAVIGVRGSVRWEMTWHLSPTIADPD